MHQKILILFAHPAFQKSRVNRILTDGLLEAEGVTFHDLYQCYPEMDIDVSHEQDLLLQHDVIIFHHPFYWYSTPAILKEWQDLVLLHGWAYGSKGNALKGKTMLNVISTGGGQKAYCEQGYNRFTMRQLLAPLEQTARLCKMRFLPPFVIHGTHSITPEEVLELKEHYHQLLELFRNNDIDMIKAEKMEYLNEYLLTQIPK